MTNINNECTMKKTDGPGHEEKKKFNANKFCFRKDFNGMNLITFVDVGHKSIVVRRHKNKSLRLGLPRGSQESMLEQSTKNIMGKAICHPDDEFNVGIGYNIALARFMKKFKGNLMENYKRKMRSIGILMDGEINRALKKTGLYDGK